jgi:protease I
MSNELQGKKVAILVANSGVEEVELERPRDAIRDAGGEAVLVAPERGKVQAFNHDVEPGEVFEADAALGDVSADGFDALVLPGGTTNPDHLRTIPAAVDFVHAFVVASKPVAAICHGPWTLVEADVVRGKTLTSWPSLRTDIRNAGGTWVDEQVYVCPGSGWKLVTSRKPDDLDAFCAAIVDTFRG